MSTQKTFFQIFITFKFLLIKEKFNNKNFLHDNVQKTSI